MEQTILVQVDGAWEDERVEVSWTNPNEAFPDGRRVPLELRLYQLSSDRADSTLLSTELITQSDSDNTTFISYTNVDCPPDSSDHIPLLDPRTPCYPWELGFSLGLQGQSEGSVLGLLDTLTLLPPENITVECGEVCLVSWCLEDHQQHFQVNHTSTWPYFISILTNMQDRVIGNLGKFCGFVGYFVILGCNLEIPYQTTIMIRTIWNLGLEETKQFL